MATYSWLLGVASVRRKNRSFFASC